MTSSKTLRLFISGFSLVLLFSLVTVKEVAALSITGQNKIRYGRQAVSQTGLTDDLYYLENYFELFASFEKFRFHVRQRYLMPSEYGQRLDGLAAFDKIDVEYITDHLRIKGGDFYQEWGRGLLMGSLESIDLNFDSGLEGLVVEGDYKNFEVSIFRGVEVDTTNTVQEGAGGGMLSYRFPFGLKLGGSIIHLDDGIRHEAIDRRGVEGEYIFDFGSAYVSYTTDSYFYGTYPHGFYSALEFFGRNWAVLLDYKNYRFAYYVVPALLFPPQVFPENIMYLFSRNKPATHFTNDVGLQADLTYRWNDWDFNLNVNQSSYQEKIKILPSLDLSQRPFWSTFFSAEYAPLGKDRVLFQGGYMENTALNYRYGAGTLYEWRINRKLSLTGELQFDKYITPTWVDDIAHWGGYREAYLLVGLAKSHFGTITGTLGMSNDPWASQGAIPKGWLKSDFWGKDMYWPAILLTADFMEQHQLRVFYGYDRGGLGCAGGLCRWVPPFRGIKVSLTSQF
ncbi:MAG: hypothetical protein HN356_11715 [Calditrichaeota bacterium]|nr:hypothetical protein [Calditrichota bacterium]MBT7788448.1 hypothetical protein [Calditrichota bacterium]